MKNAVVLQKEPISAKERKEILGQSTVWRNGRIRIKSLMEMKTKGIQITTLTSQLAFQDHLAFCLTSFSSDSSAPVL